jgi:hypothetical protein
MIKQVTVFLENDKGRLADMCHVLAEANISMSALTIADTTDYGVARIIVDAPDAALTALTTAGFRAKLVEVTAVEIPNVAGGLAKLLQAFDEANINLEYAYCFANGATNAIDIFRVEQIDAVAAIVEKVGFRQITADELYH